MKKRTKKRVKEELWNIPNILTGLRILLTIVIIYLIFAGFSIWTVVIVFVIAMLTDCADGFIARHFHEKIKFGAKFDMVADRILYFGTVISVLIYYSYTGYFGNQEYLQIILISLREIFATPVLLYHFFRGNRRIPPATIPAKATTFFQAVAFPLILLKFWFSWIVVIPCAIFGLYSACEYFLDMRKLVRKK